MRPLRLEIAGFTTFREPVELDLADASYFALVGPTGSGKSSVIDAMSFALYGSVPRLDMRSVLPVISQGKQEARVRLDFAIGEETYTAVRVVRKIGPDRATTKEARLERGDEVLAGDADGVTSEVERLLGLRFEQFTRCVVLPQGEFARFMHDKPAARQDLLVRLLGLDVYERMAQRANQVATAHEATLALQRERLEQDLSFATEAALVSARAQMRVLETLLQRIDAQEPRLEELRHAVRTARTEEETAVRAVEALGTIGIPGDIERLAAAEGEARDLAARADELADAAERSLREAEEARKALPEPAPLERALDAHERATAVEREIAVAGKDLEKLRKATERAVASAEKAERAAHDAQGALEAARTQHRAHDLARALVAGEACPVCRQKVAKVPRVTTPADLGTAEKTFESVTKAHRDADAARAHATAALAASHARADELAKQAKALAPALEAHPDPAQVRAQLEAIRGTEQAVTARRKEATDTRAQAAQARKAIDQVAAELKRARRDLDTARDRVADLSPPPLGHEDLAQDWRALDAWAQQQAGRRRSAASAARERAQAAETEGKAIADRQRAACVEAGIEDVTNPRDDCLKAIERARGAEERIELALETAKQVAEDIRAKEESATVARALGGHLKANAFERWVLRQALTTLVDGATHMLLELSNGMYSLTLDRNFNFAVIDHRNANMERSARTLSGGETFLASLALALALSDRIATLSANTAVRLESIFLDEGFGTLDQETLETVATAIESLSALNRVVGVVTHVRDLAERVPVRFEVRKGPVTSTVEKVLG